MKTLYEILEVSENASKEIIEKAYKVLVKKYHPDLQPQEKKQIAKQTMQQINEAYSILSDENKRKTYDEKLKAQREQIYYENSFQQTSKKDLYYKENKKENYNTQQMQNYMQEQEVNEKIKQEMQKQYQQKYEEAYEGYLRSMGYKVKEKWTLKRLKDLCVSILVVIVICTILWFFSPTHKILVDFYESNPIIKSVIDVFINIIIGIWNGIRAIIL